ncbi:protein phosphatase CheZ [Asticcacaulis sp. AC402]|uniref:protein phosphatase CheZ n=1 Tax=Asticcacaulis sp. AC402 TaxID=1282361 RepID=UPI0003C3D849|nr:protein phosphatase CheZ [Asticcacaulis sp. AC402]ESQ73599.1 hypothetical protein ABAC402_18420 [Asticcacaulis sp. AC402]
MTEAHLERPSYAADILGMFDPDLLRMTAVSEELLGLMDGFYQRLDRRTSDEFLAIANDIANTRTELRRLCPNQIGDSLPCAGAELDAITRDTETATNTILGAAEALMDLDATAADVKDKADDLVMRIFEACSFQDLVGQRVSKVVRVLEQIEARIGRLSTMAGEVETEVALEPDLDAAEQRRRDLLLNGPAVGGPETSQAQVDAYFN